MNTICAISTAPGVGGIAIIRVSGIQAFTITQAVAQLKCKKELASLPAYSVHLGTIVNKSQEEIDEVLFMLFKNPYSFTGEDVVEIACHGSLFIQQKILELLIDQGARLAQPGEFTQRAFLNGKMDLTQAEAVADLITSSSAAEHRLAINQMRGGFSKELQTLRAHLLHFISLIELELDFGEEEVEFADRKQLYELVTKIEQVLSDLVHSFQVGRAIKNGIPVAIVGETNAGKSTLLNLLLNEEKAIVSEIHGTTRDSIEDTVIIQGINFRFIDTAGIRNTNDIIENLGIERTYHKLEQASIVILLLDSLQDLHSMHALIDSMIERCIDKKLVVVFNKTDLLSSAQMQELRTIELHADLDASLFISAKFNQNGDELKQVLSELAQLSPVGENQVVITNLRHYEALKQAHEAIVRTKEGLDNGISSDFLAMDIRACLRAIGSITGGEIETDEILGNIFKNFCIGK